MQGRRLLLRALLSLIAAGAVAGGAFYATYLAGCRAMQCVDVTGLVPMLAGLGVGCVAGAGTDGAPHRSSWQ